MQRAAALGDEQQAGRAEEATAVLEARVRLPAQVDRDVAAAEERDEVRPGEAVGDVQEVEAVLDRVQPAIAPGVGDPREDEPRAPADGTHVGEAPVGDGQRQRSPERRGRRPRGRLDREEAVVGLVREGLERLGRLGRPAGDDRVEAGEGLRGVQLGAEGDDHVGRQRAQVAVQRVGGAGRGRVDERRLHAAGDPLGNGVPHVRRLADDGEAQGVAHRA